MARPRSNIAPRILRAARARFLHDGVDGASLRDIARAAGTSVGMIHYYFPAKADLFLAVVEEVYAHLSDEITAIMIAPGTLEQRMEGFYVRIARASQAELDIIRLVLREILVSSARRRLLVERFLRGHIPAMLGAIMLGFAGGEIDPRHLLPAVGLATLSTAIFPQLIRRLVDESQVPMPLPSPEDLARALVKVIFLGVKPRA